MMLLASTLLAVQPQQAGNSASVEGIVHKLGTTEPIAGVDLELRRVESVELTADASGLPSTPTQPPRVFAAKSGRDGKFAFQNLPSGSYKLVAARIGGLFTPVEYGQRGVLGRGVLFPIGDGQQLRDVRLEMAPVGSISGRVFDENGRGIGHATVMALSPVYRDGQQFLNIMQFVHTDDRGEYRLFSLVPGRYYVAVRPEDLTRRSVPLPIVPPGRRAIYEQAVSPVVTKRILPTGDLIEESYGFVYFGGVTDARMATPISLPPGGNFGAVDIPLDAGRVRASHIRGKVINGVTGAPAAGAAVRLVPRTFSAHTIMPVAVTDAQGAFDLSGVVPGAYNLYSLGANIQASAAQQGVSAPPPIPLMTMLPIEMADKDVDNLSLVIAPGSTIQGRLTVDGAALDERALTQVRLELEPIPTGVATVSPVSGLLTANGTTQIQNVWPADYRIKVTSLPPTGYVKSIRMAGMDFTTASLKIPVASDNPLEILIGTDAGSLEGRVMNDRQIGSPNVKVALVPEQELRGRLDLYRNTTTDLTGSFQLTGIAPGNYTLYAWEEVEDGAWMDPTFVRYDEGRGQPVRVAGRRKESVSLIVIPAKR
jgi:protocatechuate 3,4-dioxygenase beta subunit